VRNPLFYLPNANGLLAVQTHGSWIPVTSTGMRRLGLAVTLPKVEVDFVFAGKQKARSV
jgi:hypothetical protein